MSIRAGQDNPRGWWRWIRSKVVFKNPLMISSGQKQKFAVTFGSVCSSWHWNPRPGCHDLLSCRCWSSAGRSSSGGMLTECQRVPLPVTFAPPPSLTSALEVRREPSWLVRRGSPRCGSQVREDSIALQTATSRRTLPPLSFPPNVVHLTPPNYWLASVIIAFLSAFVTSLNTRHKREGNG